MLCTGRTRHARVLASCMASGNLSTSYPSSMLATPSAVVPLATRLLGMCPVRNASSRRATSSSVAALAIAACAYGQEISRHDKPTFTVDWMRWDLSEQELHAKRSVCISWLARLGDKKTRHEWISTTTLLACCLAAQGQLCATQSLSLDGTKHSTCRVNIAMEDDSADLHAAGNNDATELQRQALAPHFTTQH